MEDRHVTGMPHPLTQRGKGPDHFFDEFVVGDRCVHVTQEVAPDIR